MAMKDLHNNVNAAISLTVAARTATTNGASVDLAGFNAAEVFVVTGTITDGTHTISLEESDDNTTFSTVAASNLLGSAPTITAPDDDKVFRFGYVGGKRYVRVKTTVSGATSGGTYGAIVLRGYPIHAPVT